MHSDPVAALPLTPVTTAGVVDEVHQALLDMLVAGSLEPDSNLSIDGLARSLDVSPTPVREALARLEHTGLVVRAPRRGYRVAPRMSSAQMAELLEARQILESGAVRRAVERDGEALTSALEKALDEHRRASLELKATTGVGPENLRPVYEYFQKDWAFHQVILDHCGNRYINRAVNSLAFSVHRMRQSVTNHTTDAQTATEEHRKILEMVKTGDAEGAEQAMAQHLTHVAERTLG